MSTSSQHSRPVNRRINSVQKNGDFSSDGSKPRKRIVTHNDAYLFALRVAYLTYLLQSQAKRTQQVSTPPPSIQRSSSSINDLIKDFSLLRDSKSTRFPHGFMSELEKRLTGVIMGKEKKPEYNDARVKMTFAAFFNAFTEQGFRKRMEKDRRVEELVLIFFSKATQALQTGKAQNDDSWRFMADRHLALFVRLISLILKDHEWSRDRPELSSRLSTLETKLLANDQDLTSQSSKNVGGSSTVEIIVPRSYEVKDMQLVQAVGRIFGLTNTQIQSDIDKNKLSWTAEAALRDLKTYQNLLSLNSRKTLRSDDFDLEEAYEAWKKSESPDLSQMMLTIVQSSPELAKSTARSSFPLFNSLSSSSEPSDSGHSDLSRKMSEVSDVSSYTIDLPVDMSFVNSVDSNSEVLQEEDNTFTFIPPDSRSYYRFILSQALTYDLKDDSLQSSTATAETPAIKLLSKSSTELLNEIALRWRIPFVSRIVIFLDVIREKYVEGSINLDTLDEAFNFVKEPLPDNRKTSNNMASLLFDRTKWTLVDYALNQQVLASVDDALLRELYDVALQCYESKPPSVGPIIYVLEHHIYDDPNFSKSPEDLDLFAQQLHEGLKEKAFILYKEYLEKHLPQDQHSWEFFHIIELGKAVMALAQRIQKRYRKNPEIMGLVLSSRLMYIRTLTETASRVNPLTALVETILPLYAEDARDIVARILQLAKQRGEEVPFEDGFDLYRELVEVRKIHSEALPK